jgi:protein-S-isoprenylcysteine O-methyltransferase Ste14
VEKRGSDRKQAAIGIAVLSLVIIINVLAEFFQDVIDNSNWEGVLLYTIVVLLALTLLYILRHLRGESHSSRSSDHYC